MKIRILHLLGILFPVVCFLLILPVVSQVNAGENEDFRFAQRLRSDGMFVAAAEEFLRFADRYPRSIFRPAALFSAGEAYMQAGKAIEALDVLETFLESYPADENACKARLYRGRIFKALHRYREAANEMLIIPEKNGDCPFAGQALLDAGECLLSAGDPEEAVGVLRRLITDRERSDLVPRALYSLALALANLREDLEAERVLRELVADHPASPVAALALLKLGEGALDKGDTREALEYFKKAAKDYREKSLNERASLKIIEIHARMGNDRAALNESERFLDGFPGSKQRGVVYRRSIDAAWRLGRFDKALSLIDSSASEGAVRDSTGELLLLKGRILSGKGRKKDALEALKDFRHEYSGSPMLKEALILEAELYHLSGAPRDAARIYHLALLEGAGGEERISILSRLADISAYDLGDTLSAVRYWEMIFVEDSAGEMGEEALWKASSAREVLGDRAGASAGYTRLVKGFPYGRFAEEAGARLEAMEILASWGESAVKKLAGAAVRDEPSGIKHLGIGVILLDDAGDADGAVPFLEKALEDDLPDSLDAKVRYYLGKAHFRKYRIASARGEEAKRERKKALSLWQEVARDFTGSRWGALAHRAYLETRFTGWKPAERLERLDEFLKFYNDVEERSWAIGKKIDFLYELAGQGESWAADSALALSGEILNGRAADVIKKEVLLKRGYLMRMNEDLEGAARAFEGFVSGYGDDPRSTPVLYDLGETLLRLGKYGRALDAYKRCLGKRPRRSLAGKCMLREGDCYYYIHRFEEAAAAYGAFVERYPGGELADEASYREALALEGLGEDGRADSILTVLAGEREVTEKLRVRLVRKLGQRLLVKGKPAEARPLIEELVSLERAPGNLVLLGSVLLELGEYEPADRNYSGALKLGGADTCLILAGRARARFHLNEFKGAMRDLENLVALCPGRDQAAGILLERGIVETEAGRCNDAGITLQDIRERYAGTEEAARALYHLSICDIKGGRYEQAIERLTAFLRESPHSLIVDQAYFKLASAHFGAGNMNLAVVNYGMAAEASKDDDLIFLALRNAGRVNQRLEDWEKAASTWQRITERFPDREGIVEVFFNLGFCYGQAGRFEMAYEVYGSIPAIASSEEQQGRAHYWSGICLKNLGKYAEAVREFLRVPYLRTGGMWGVTAKLEAAACYENMGQLDQAENIYQAVISAHGETSDWGRLAKKSLDRIRSAREKEDKGTGTGKGPGGGETR